MLADTKLTSRDVRLIPESAPFSHYNKGKLGVYELMGVKEYAASILGRKADIVTRDSLHKTFREAKKQQPSACFSGSAFAGAGRVLLFGYLAAEG